VNLISHPRFSVRRSKINEVDNTSSNRALRRCAKKVGVDYPASVRTARKRTRAYTPVAAERLEAILGVNGLGNVHLANFYVVRNISGGGALWGQKFGDTLKLKGKSDLVVVPTNTAVLGYAKQLRVT